MKHLGIYVILKSETKRYYIPRLPMPKPTKVESDKTKYNRRVKHRKNIADTQ